MGMKALFTYDYGKEKMDRLRSLGYDILVVKEDGLTYSDEIGDAEIMVCYNPFKTLDIQKMRNLKWIQLSSVGIDQVPIEYIKKQGIILTNNRGGYGIPIGEWVVLKILELLKQSYSFYRNQQTKIWKVNTSLLELYGKTVGFIGTGNIALESAKRLKGFDVRLLGINTSGRTVGDLDECFSLEKIDEVLGRCDIVVVTIPYTSKTHRLINKDRFKAMKRGSFLINVSRGAIVDEIELINNLKSGKIGGAALDVFEQEPLCSDSPLWDMDNVIITPHNSWISEKRNDRRFEIIYENMRRYINNEELKNVIDFKKGY
ncbi:phosphoglycerate dehydrogenase [Fonticella tunisiensis]|nr:phosphoglycerate dehydrogenase [Fonticella tunisiensis]